MKRFIVILLAVAGFVTPLTAQNTDYIFVKNGSSYEGYISKQEPGVSISVTAQQATLFVASEKITDLKIVTKDVADLSDSMHNWVNKNCAGMTEMEVASLKISGIQYDDMLVLEKGVRYKLLSFKTREYKLAWGDIVKTCKNEDFYKKNSGICDVVTLKSGKRFKGTIIEQVIGVELKIKNEKNSVETIRFADILSIHSEQVNYNTDIWQQLPLLDKVELKGGTVLTGFISSRMMGQSIIFIEQSSLVERSIALKDIVKYYKLVNPKYVAPSTDSDDNAKDGDEEDKKDANEAKPHDKNTERTSRWNDNSNVEKVEEAVKEELPTSQSAGITINGKSATLNLVQTKDGIHYLIYDVVDIVPKGRNLRINLPMSISAKDVKIIKLRSYNTPDSEDKKLPGWTDDDAAASDVKMSSIDSATGVDGRWHLEIKSEDIGPGIYVLVPLIDACRCLSFQVRP